MMLSTHEYRRPRTHVAFHGRRRGVSSVISLQKAGQPLNENGDMYKVDSEGGSQGGSRGCSMATKTLRATRKSKRVLALFNEPLWRRITFMKNLHKRYKHVFQAESSMHHLQRSLHSCKSILSKTPRSQPRNAGGKMSGSEKPAIP